MSKYTIHEVLAYLSTLGEVKQYYISMLDGPGSEVVHYIDEDASWVLMEDNNDMLLSVISYLKAQDVPVFTEVEQINNFNEDQD